MQQQCLSPRKLLLGNDKRSDCVCFTSWLQKRKGSARSSCKKPARSSVDAACVTCNHMHRNYAGGSPLAGLSSGDVPNQKLKEGARDHIKPPRQEKGASASPWQSAMKSGALQRFVPCTVYAMRQAVESVCVRVFSHDVDSACCKGKHTHAKIGLFHAA